MVFKTVSSKYMINLHNNLEKTGLLLISLSVPYLGSRFFCFIFVKSISYANSLVKNVIEFVGNPLFALRYAISIWELFVCLTKKKLSYFINFYFVLFCVCYYLSYLIIEENVRKTDHIPFFSLRGAIEELLDQCLIIILFSIVQML